MNKKAHIRGYLMLLLGEGTFANTKSPTEIVMRASAAFARDVAEVVGEMAAELGAAGSNKFTATLTEIGSRALANIAGLALDRLRRG